MNANLSVSGVYELYAAARRAATPLLAIQSLDQRATILRAREVDKDGTMYQWDYLGGAVALVSGSQSINNCAQDPVAIVKEFTETSPDSSTLYMIFADTWLKEPSIGPLFVQALWNSRDLLKSRGKAIVLLGNTVAMLPPALDGDVMVIDEPLPSREELGQIVDDLLVLDDGHKIKVSSEVRERAIDAVVGLPAFQAEQSVAMSLSKSKGIMIDRVWGCKREVIKKTKALTVYEGTERYSDIGGCESVKSLMTMIMKGKSRPNAIVFIDEIEKALSGAGGGDLSGVSTDQLGVMLTHMQDTGAVGVIFVGPPGAAKSAVAKATGNEGEIPTFCLDLGAAKGSLVGQSEELIRTAMKVISAASENKTLWIATSNNLSAIPPELRRRFTLGIYYFDLPPQSTREQIWSIYGKKYFGKAIPAKDRPDDAGWTGAEIKQCCDIAWRVGKTPKECGSRIVPVSRSAAPQLDALRTMASGKFISAETGEVFQMEEAVDKAVAPAASRRSLKVAE